MQKFLCWALLMLAVIGAFAATVNGDYVWDDRFLVRDNAHNLQLNKAGWLFGRDVFASSTPPRRSSAYRPLVMLSYAVDRTLLGHHARSYHLGSLLWHLLAVTLLFALVWRWTASLPAALVAGVLMGLHPSQTEAVSWISGRQDVLPAVWVLAALLINSTTRRPWVRVIGVPLAIFAALLSKENAIAAPLLLLLADQWIHRRPWRDRWRWATYGGVLVALVAYFMLRRHAGLGGDLPLSLAALAQLSVDAVGLLAKMAEIAVYPVRSSSVMMYKPPGPYLVLSVAVIAALVVVVSLMVWRRVGTSPLWAQVNLGALWFVAALLPAALAIPATQVISERYFYLPSAGVAIALAGAAQWFTALTRRHFAERHANRLLAVSLLLVVAMQAGIVRQQVRNWRTDRTLFRNILGLDPYNSVAASQLGRDHLLRGELRNALYWFDRVFRRKQVPPYVRVRMLNYATVTLLRLHHYPAAVGVGLEALKHSPTPNNHYNVGLALLQLSDQRPKQRKQLRLRALHHFQLTLKAAPFHDRARLFAAQCHEGLGQLRQAVKLLMVARPNSPIARQIRQYLAKLQKLSGDEPEL